MDSPFAPGDNILTALSIARECGMIKKNDTVISVHVLLSGGGDGRPCIQWTYADDMMRQVKEVSAQSEVTSNDTMRM